MHDSFEEVTPGETVDLGRYDVTRAEIIAFAESYDPQEFHLTADHDAPFDGLIASGWHTAAMTMRLLVDEYLSTAGALGALGLNGLRWREPVRPGDTLSATLTLGEKDIWDETRGVVTQEIRTTNQSDDQVLWMESEVLYRRAGD